LTTKLEVSLNPNTVHKKYQRKSTGATAAGKMKKK